MRFSALPRPLSVSVSLSLAKKINTSKKERKRARKKERREKMLHQPCPGPSLVPLCPAGRLLTPAPRAPLWPLQLLSGTALWRLPRLPHLFAPHTFSCTFCGWVHLESPLAPGPWPLSTGSFPLAADASSLHPLASWPSSVPLHPSTTPPDPSRPQGASPKG